MGGMFKRPKVNMPPDPPPPADYADQAAKVAGQMKGTGARRRSFMSSGAARPAGSAKRLLGE